MIGELVFSGQPKLYPAVSMKAGHATFNRFSTKRCSIYINLCYTCIDFSVVFHRCAFLGEQQTKKQNFMVAIATLKFVSWFLLVTNLYFFMIEWYCALLFMYIEGDKEGCTLTYISWCSSFLSLASPLPNPSEDRNSSSWFPGGKSGLKIVKKRSPVVSLHRTV